MHIYSIHLAHMYMHTHAFTHPIGFDFALRRLPVLLPAVGLLKFKFKPHKSSIREGLWTDRWTKAQSLLIGQSQFCCTLSLFPVGVPKAASLTTWLALITPVSWKAHCTGGCLWNSSRATCRP